MPTSSAQPRRANIRGVLAFAGVALMGLTFVLPATGWAVTPLEKPLLSAAQTVTVPAVAAPDLVERDAFGFSKFWLVQWPVAAGTTISSGFGYRSCSGCTTNHTGIDFIPGAGADVQAVADGVVVESGYASDYGVHVVLRHELDGEVVETLYAHLQDDGAMSFAPGEQVARGTVLGHVGATGLATGPHLHFAVRYGEQLFVDPYPWLLSHVNT